MKITRYLPIVTLACLFASPGWATSELATLSPANNPVGDQLLAPSETQHFEPDPGSDSSEELSQPQANGELSVGPELKVDEPIHKASE